MIINNAWFPLICHPWGDIFSLKGRRGIITDTAHWAGKTKKAPLQGLFRVREKSTLASKALLHPHLLVARVCHTFQSYRQMAVLSTSPQNCYN